jgi:hypothetical protein
MSHVWGFYNLIIIMTSQRVGNFKNCKPVRVNPLYKSICMLHLEYVLRIQFILNRLQNNINNMFSSCKTHIDLYKGFTLTDLQFLGCRRVRSHLNVYWDYISSFYYGLATRK